MYHIINDYMANYITNSIILLLRYKIVVDPDKEKQTF